MNTLSGILFRRIPFITLFLLLWLAGCFIFESAINAFAIPFSYRIGPSLGISQSIASNGHFLRFITSSFFHANLGHFISNSIGLIVFLSLLEFTIGSYRALLVVLVSALGGTIGSVIFEWVQYMVGSSTILFGVYGALGVLIIKYRHELGRHFILITIIWLINLVFSVLAGYLSLEIVDQGAHIGGFIAGALVTFFITRGISITELQAPISPRMKLIAVTLAVVFGISCIVETLALWKFIT